MSEGCMHAPPADLSGYEVTSFTESPQSTSRACVVTSSANCNSWHAFEVHNYHLYNVNAVVNAYSIAQEIEEADSKQTQWEIEGEIPAAPYRPPRGQPIYGKRRLRVGIRAITDRISSQETIAVDYEINSSPNGRMTGIRFGVLVDLI
jgi:hypothetical protein